MDGINAYLAEWLQRYKLCSADTHGYRMKVRKYIDRGITKQVSPYFMKSGSQFQEMFSAMEKQIKSLSLFSFD
jgi:hypothetical protein